MTYYKINLPPLSIAMCRATFKTVAKFIGILSILFSFFVQAATPEQIEMIQSAAEQHIHDTVEQPQGGELFVNSANVDSRIKATDCPVPLETSASTTTNTRSSIKVLVQCIPDEWRVYVPVRLSMSRFIPSKKSSPPRPSCSTRRCSSSRTSVYATSECSRKSSSASTLGMCQRSLLSSRDSTTPDAFCFLRKAPPPSRPEFRGRISLISMLSSARK